MEIYKFWGTKNSCHQTPIYTKLEYKKLTSEQGFAFIEAMLALSILATLLATTLKINSRFDRFERKSIENFKTKWDELEGQYGKNE